VKLLPLLLTTTLLTTAQAFGQGLTAPFAATPTPTAVESAAPSPEQSPPAATAAATPAGSRQSSPLDILIWEAQLAQNAFALGRTDATVSALVAAWERILGPTCMPDLGRTMEHAGGQLPAGCTDWIEKILELDEFNPPALCARDGLGSTSCRQSFARQQIETYRTGVVQNRPMGNPWLQKQEDRDLEMKLAQSGMNPQLREASRRVDNLVGQSSMPGKEAEFRGPLISALEEALRLSCRLTRVQLSTPETAAETDDTPAPVAPVFGERRQSPMEEVLSSLRQREEAAKPEIPGEPRALKRVRLISDSCLRFANQLLKIDPGHPAAICGRDGFYTPTCTDARRTFSRRPPPVRPSGGASGTTTQPESGFSAF